MEKGQGKIKIGIIGTGRITKRFVPEAGTVKEVEISSVYNPRFSSAESFAREYHIAGAASRMEEFLAKVDAVYIASPHNTHVSYARQMLSAGKHVLCEKPMAFTSEEAKELFALAEEKKLVLMEAVKTAYCPGFAALSDVVQSGIIGKVYDVEACFTKLSLSNTREIWDERCGGSFLELGSYPLLPIVRLLGTGNIDIQFQTIPMGNGKDGYTKAIFRYPDAMALAKTGLSVKSEGQLVVSGSKGYILAESPWWLTKKFEVRFEDSSKREIYEFPFEGAGLRYEIQEFAGRIFENMIRNGHETGSIGKDNRVFEVESGIGMVGISPEESIWIAGQMEAFLTHLSAGFQGHDTNVQSEKIREDGAGKKHPKEAIRIWAHRGCSMRYPENTLEAFEAAASIEGLTGIELDVQLTKDGELVVIHDETVDRTTNGTGEVRSYTLKEIKALSIQGEDDATAVIPTLEEVFQILQSKCHDQGLMINIELKNSRIRYEGMEEKVLTLAEEYHLNSNIVYSSFLPESMGLIKLLNSNAKTGILGNDMLQCWKDMERMHADAVHPWNGGLFLNEADIREIRGIPVRVWNTEEPLFGQDRALKETNLTKYAELGVTDIITNVPENYLRK